MTKLSDEIQAIEDEVQASEREGRPMRRMREYPYEIKFWQGPDETGVPLHISLVGAYSGTDALDKAIRGLLYLDAELDHVTIKRAAA